MPVLSLMLLVAGAPAWAVFLSPRSSCAAPTSTADVQVALELAEAGYADADLVALEAATARASDALPCVVEPVSRSLAARYHRIMGMQAFVEGREDDAERAFAAARSIEPAYTFPPEVVPAGNPILDHYVALSVDSPKTLPVPLPAEGSLSFDGRQTDQQPLSWPSIVQLTDGAGAIAATAWVPPAGDLPAYRPAAVDTTATTATTVDPVDPGGDSQTRQKTLTRKLPWLAGTAACAAATGTLFALSRSAASTYRDPETTGEAELDRLRGQANGLLYASAGTAVATVGLGAVTIAF